jgi:succinate dehydrogenase/fumarate reductase cytochrome b subunit
MSTFLAILLIAAMLATVAALVRGIVLFLQNATAEAKGHGPSSASLKSNKMMQMRIIFQAIALFIVVLILFLYGRT